MLAVSAGKRPERPSVEGRRPISDKLWILVELCWSQNPQERPTMSGVLNIMKNMNFGVTSFVDE
jgi:hypothetical protein